MRIDELFDKPVAGTDLDYPDAYVAEAVIGGRKIQFVAERADSDEDNENYSKWLVTFSEGRKFDMTGSGDEIKVMSFVVSCMQKFIAKYNPEKFMFSAHEHEASRVTVYRRMLKRLKGYTCHEEDFAGEIGFNLTRSDLL